MDRSLVYPRLVARRAGEMPDRVFMQDVAGPSATFSQLHEQALRWAGLYERLGVGHGDRVVVMLPCSLDFFRSSLGLSWLGAVEVPINIEYRGALLAYAINMAQTSVLVIDARFVEQVEAVAGELRTVRTVVVVGEASPSLPFDVVAAETAVAEADSVEREGPEPWDVASILYTSGTTGPSKGVILPWAHLYRQTCNFIPLEDLGPADVFYGNLIATHHLAGKVIPYLMALTGGKLVFRERFSVSEFWSDVLAHGCTTAVLVGAMVPMIFAQDAPPSSPLKNLVLAPVPPNVDEYKERFGVRVATAYSMTEISNPIASVGWDVTNQNHRSCGRLKPGFEVRIVDEHDYEVPDGEIGELIVRSDEPWTMNLGYFGMPEETVRAWRNGWFHTGDAFRRDIEGNYYFIDRIKDCIRRRGENISSFEVEGLVNTHPDVVESAAVAVPSELAEDEVMMFVVRRPGSELTYEKLIEHCIKVMPRFMVPRYLEFVDELPKTVTLRVRKGELRERGVTDRTWDREKSGIVVRR